MKRFSIVESGYDINEVNKFIDIVIKRLEQLDNELRLSKSQVDILTIQLEEAKKQDDKITKTLFAIQEASDRLKIEAKEEANLIVEEARKNANAIVHEALLEASLRQKEALLIKKNITVYKARVKSLLEAQLEIAEDLDKIDL